MTTSLSQFKKMPVIVRVLIYLGANYLLIFLAQVITGILSIKNAALFNLVLCALLLLFTSFILKLEGKSFRNIGCTLGGRQNLLQLAAGTGAGMVMLIAIAFTMRIFTGFHWIINPAFKWYELLTSLMAVFCSVFVQELSFRGYPFRLMLDKWGEWPAQIVTAILFGCMHIHEEMQVKEILLTMLTTGSGSILFGLAVIKTRSLHLAIGIHFGWNYLQHLIPRHISQNGEGIWLVQGGRFDIGVVLWIAPYMIIAALAFLIIKIYPFSKPFGKPGKHHLLMFGRKPVRRFGSNVNF